MQRNVKVCSRKTERSNTKINPPSHLRSSPPTVQDIVFQLQRFVSGMSHYYDECYAVLKEADVFPIEVDLSRTMINYSSPSLSYAGDEEEEEEEEEEGGGGGGGGAGRQAENGAEKLIDDEWERARVCVRARWSPPV